LSQIKEFYAVTDTGTVFHAEQTSPRDARAVQIAQRGDYNVSKIALKGEGKLYISSYLSMGGPTDGQSPDIAALFVDREKAIACSKTNELYPCSRRWMQETLEVLSRIGPCHPVFAISQEPKKRLALFN